MSLKKFFSSQLHKQIIIFFHENPNSIDTPRGIAAWVGCSRDEAKKALEELAEARILNSISTSSTSGYSCTHDKDILKRIKKLIKQIGDGSQGDRSQHKK